MKVSVIIPNYNHAPYLEERIESVLNQTYRDFEVIILDDCSTDNSREVIEKYRGHDKISQIVYNEQNSGSTFKQWEKGISVAKGEWIWIAESDDWCELNFLDVVLPKNQNDIVLSFCGSIMYRNNNIISYPPTRYLDQTIDGADFCKRLLTSGCYINNASMCVFKRDYSEHIMEVTDYKLCGDWHFWIKLSVQGKVKINGRVLNYFRKHDADVSGKRFKDGTFYLEFIKIQNLLLNVSIINRYKYNKNILIKYCEIEKVVTDAFVSQLIIKKYRQTIGKNTIDFYLKYYIFIIDKLRKSILNH